MPAKAKKSSAKDASSARGGAKAAPAKEAAAKRKKPSIKRGRGQKAKTKTRTGKYTLKLKGWLQTPADWARFNAWAKVNALPRKYPEPEPIVRPSKPLSKLRKRMKLLSTPRTVPDPSVLCRLDWSIPRTALTVVASRRLLLLALPQVKLCDYGRVYYKVSPAALKYEPSERLLELSKPHCIKEKRKPKERTSNCLAGSLDQDRLNELSECKKLLKNPGVLTPEEWAMIFTPFGVNRRALVYKITPWTMYLALPKYTLIRHRKDPKAREMKKQIVEEGEERGKEALAEQQRKRGTKRKHAETTEQGEGDAEDEDEKKEKKKRAKKRKLEKHAWRYAPYPCDDDAFAVKKTTLTGKVPPGTDKLAEPHVHKSTACRKDPYTVKKAALSASASERVESLAKPRSPRDPVEKKPPREKDAYGKPIFEMPPYGKVLPKTKPYKMGECPSDETKKKRKIRKKRPIDPIAYKSTYDPQIDPELAEKQKRERKRAGKLPKRKQKREDRGEKREAEKGQEKEEEEEKKREEEKEKEPEKLEEPEEE
nr:calponin homology domain-containing protein DDB_G0272472-like [Megalopta genalis]